MKTLEFSPALSMPVASLLADAFDALHAKVAIEGRIVQLEPDSSGSYRADASITLAHENGTAHYLAECKSSIDRKVQIDQVHRQLASTGSASLLVAPYISRELAEYCRAIGLQFIDASGNAFLQASGLFVFIIGEKSARSGPAFRAPKGLTNAAALRVVFALLAKPGLLTSPFKEIAHHAGVSIGTANNVLEDLERRGYLLNKKSAERRRLLERDRLIDEWVINFPTTLRSRLNGRRFSAPDPTWWRRADLPPVAVVWGSEVAATKMTGYLKPATQTLYVEQADMADLTKALVKEYRIRPDHDGEIEILEKFWHWEPATTPDVAPPLLVYAELLALMDPRAQETAHMIKERLIDASFDKG